MKIYCILGNSPYIEATSGDRINELNTYKALATFADVYYNGVPLDKQESIKKSIIDVPSGYDIYYIRNNKHIFRSIKDGKKIYFCVPNHQICFQNADVIAYITEAWRDGMGNMPELANIYKESDYIPPKSIVFNQITYPQDLSKHKEVIKIRNRYGNKFMIGHFGRIIKSNYPSKFIEIIDKLDVLALFTDYKNIKFAKNITVIPRLPYDYMKYMISACDLLLYNQDKQGEFAGSLKVIDAMSYGVPILSPRYKARIDELGVDYPLYYDSSAEMLEKIQWLQSNPEEHLKLKQYMLDKAVYYNQENSAKRFKEQLEKI